MSEGILKTQYRKTILEAHRGDITEVAVEAIVNPANSFLIMGGGVAGAIKRKGGSNIETEAQRSAPMPIGQSIATSAGKLNAKYVIHAPTMETPAQRTSLKAVSKALKGALKCADEKHVESIAIPGLGTGVGGVDENNAARIMIRETLRHIDGGTGIQRIVFIGYSVELANAFAKELEDIEPIG
ncbi:MAG: macro domain-containing protein [Candidatus Hodarchaeota archaeon]